MPVMNGAEFRREPPTDPSLANIPVVVFSAHAADAPSKRVAIDVFLPKPLDVDRLLATLAQYCAE